jgi:hypothetical protein
MLRITADVNGTPIGYLFVHNTGHRSGDVHLYNAAFWNPETGDGLLGIEGIPHPRPEGWGALVLRVLRRVEVVPMGE